MKRNIINALILKQKEEADRIFKQEEQDKLDKEEFERFEQKRKENIQNTQRQKQSKKLLKKIFLKEERKRKRLESLQAFGIVENNTQKTQSQMYRKKKKSLPNSEPLSQPLAISEPNLFVKETTWEDLLDSEEIDDPSSLLDSIPLPLYEPKEKEILVEKVSSNELRSCICCVLGHVDAGKTLLLDKLRKTNVQKGEAGGITQQIGATFFPRNFIENTSLKLKSFFGLKGLVPGLLIIDTPGHETFSNLRSRGSSLCDLVVLVVDITSGLEKQTISSLLEIVDKNIPFVVVLNKLDKIYGWKSSLISKDNINQQLPSTKDEFKRKVDYITVQFAENKVNAKLYYENKDLETYCSMIPVSAKTGEGIPDLIGYVSRLAETKLKTKLRKQSIVKAVVLESKVEEGLGKTMDVILVNGILEKGDEILISGLKPIQTKIKSLLLPRDLKETKNLSLNQYTKVDKVEGAIGVKIIALNLDGICGGSEIILNKENAVQPPITNSVFSNLKSPGIAIHASSLGSLEALLEHFNSKDIPVASIGIGKVYKRDIVKASVNLDTVKNKELSCLLAFDIQIEKTAQQEADKLGLLIFSENIIYTLFDKFDKFQKDISIEKQKCIESEIIFPVSLVIQPNNIFATRNPLILGVEINAGVAKIGTTLCVSRKKDGVWTTRVIGKITNMQRNHDDCDMVTQGLVACKIEGESDITYGRHILKDDILYSMVTKRSIDALNSLKNFKMDERTIQLLSLLKEMFDL